MIFRLNLSFRAEGAEPCCSGTRSLPLAGPNDVLTKLSLTVLQGVTHCPDGHFLLHTEPPFAKLLGDDSFVKNIVGFENRSMSRSICLKISGKTPGAIV